MYKWQRKYILEIEGVDGRIYEFSANPNMLTLEFSIIRNNLASANTGHFRLYNLNQNTRDAIFKDYLTISDFRSIRLRAGYQSDPVLPIVFDGNLKSVVSYRGDGEVNFITEIEAYDFGFVMANCYSSWNTSELPDCTKRQVIEKLTGDLIYTRNGAEMPVPVGGISAFVGSHPRGRVIMGNTWEELRRQTDNHCYIDNGKVYCLEDDDCVGGDIIEIASGSGLLGVPRRYENMIKAEILFEPRLVVGQQVSINSLSQSRFNGTYKVTGIAHQGVISDSVNSKCKTILSIVLGSFQTI